MWWPFTWLGLGFLLKWWREANGMKTLILLFYVLLSFALIILMTCSYEVAWYALLASFVLWGGIGLVVGVYLDSKN